MYRYVVFIISLLFPICLAAQSVVEGEVTGPDKEPLQGATVHWMGTDKGTYTDSLGRFQLRTPDIENNRLIVDFVGFDSDTISVEDDQYLRLQLKESASMEEVEVKGRRPGTFVSSVQAAKTEVITSKELKKSACCDLAGCFNTQASVEPTTTNIVTDAKELRILGLSGVYNQILVDGIPRMMNGLSYTYGVSSIPGTLVDNIYVSQGANSVLQGYESISGQINVQLKQADQEEEFLFNAFTNSFLEKQFNVNYSREVGKWNTLLSAHTTQPGNSIDRDDDTFLDLPLVTRYSFYNQWKYGNSDEWGWHSKIGLRYVHEERIGGQMKFDPSTDEGSTDQYGQTIRYTQPEIYTKAGYRMNDKHHFVVHASLQQHDQNSYFGTTHFDAEQFNAYFNAQYELNWSDDHQLKTGINLRNEQLDQNISFGPDTLNRTYDGDYDRTETVPGIFIENAFHWNDRTTTLLTGIRADHHSEFGWHVSPRVLIKHNFTDRTTARASVGTGWRTVQLFSENVNLLASSRNVIIREELKPERAMNYGVNVTHKIFGEHIESQWTLDLYQTRFFNQVFPNYDVDPRVAYVSNFEGESVSNGAQAEVGIDLIGRIGIKLAYNYLDVYRIVDGDKKQLPFNAKHRLKGTFSYTPLSEDWRLDMNVHRYGKQRLPDNQGLPSEFQLPDYSDPYLVLNAQFTKSWDRLEIYAGCENIFDFRQEKPILSWENPFGPYFDTSTVWGPTKGRELYVGVRYSIDR